MVRTHHTTARALAELQERIARFGALEPDWDSYGAKAISPTAIAKAQDVLQAVGTRPASAIGDDVLGVCVAPLPNGGVLLEWHGSAAELDVEVTPTGALDLLLEERSDGSHETSERAGVDIGQIMALLDRVLAA